jgi:hypothetical protein
MGIIKVNKIIDRVVDVNTGELVDVSESFTELYTETNEEFCLVYASLWNVIDKHNLGKSDISLLGYLINHYADGTIFCINKAVKESAAKLGGKHYTSYNNSTRRLLDKKLIFEVSGRSYKLNPKYAFKGSTNERRKAIVEMHSYCPDCHKKQ